jgi:hypothetical protein
MIGRPVHPEEYWTVHRAFWMREEGWVWDVDIVPTGPDDVHDVIIDHMHTAFESWEQPEKSEVITVFHFPSGKNVTAEFIT